MRRYLVVANRTLGGQALLDEIRRRIQDGPCSFYVVVPVQSGDREAAAERLAEALRRLRSVGAEADGELGDRHPVAAAHDAMQSHPVDEIILSTLPAGVSRWIQSDTPSKIVRAFGLPVDHVISTDP